MGTRLQSLSGKVIWDPDDKKKTIKLAFLNAKDTRELVGVTKLPQAQLMTDNRAKYIDYHVNPEFGKQFQTVYSGAYKQILLELDYTFQPDFYTDGTAGNPNIDNLTQPGCEDKECPVYVCGYDWRKHVYSDGSTDILSDIQKRIFGVNGIEKKVKKLYSDPKIYSFTGQYIIVTHSMGGIVSREFLRRNKIFAKKVRAVIHIVQPAAGAPKMYATMKCGAAALAPWFPIDEQVIASFVGRSSEDAQTFLSDIPGGLTLAPNNEYDKDVSCLKPSWISWDNATKEKLRNANSKIVEKSNSLDIYDLYTEGSGYLGMVNENFKSRWKSTFIDHVDKIKGFHNSLKKYYHPETVEICSKDRKTCMGVIFEEFIKSVPEVTVLYVRDPDKPVRFKVIESRFVKTHEGDGTVPLKSQNILLRGSPRHDSHCKEFINYEHGSICKNINVIKEVIERVGTAVKSV